MAAVFLFLAFTRAGKAMLAVADNPTLAAIKGIDANVVARCVSFVGMGLAIWIVVARWGLLRSGLAGFCPLKPLQSNARHFLDLYGNPFAANGVDRNGRASIEWGVYGVPETFVVGRDSRIAFKLIGPITRENLVSVLKPEIERALALNRE